MSSKPPAPAPAIWVLGEALMDCVAQPDGSLRPHMGGSPFNLARAAALRLGGGELGTRALGTKALGDAAVAFITPLSTDRFGDQMRAQFAQDGVHALLPPSRLPTSLAVVQIAQGQPSYGFYREGVADRDYAVDALVALLAQRPPGILHTGSLHLVPPEHVKVLAVLQQAKRLGWTISVDVNLRPQLAADLPAYIVAVKQVAAQADWVKASDEDLALLGFATPHRADAPAMAAYFTRQGASRVALTFGAEGAWLQVGGATAQQDVPAVTVVDTVGAGDTFWGNCLADWALQPSGAGQRVAVTLQTAMRAAAINCTRAGCQPPRRSELV